MKKMNLLIVDDEPALCKVLGDRLNVLYGITPDACHNGAEALELIRNNDYDVVVLDIEMPGMDGMETLKRIKAAHPAVEVIMLTGHANVDVAIRGMEQGAFDYLMKPAEMDDLYYKIQDAHKKIQLSEKS